jgi:hypothetical protein
MPRSKINIDKLVRDGEISFIDTQRIPKSTKP